MKLAKYVMKKLKRMAINMLFSLPYTYWECLFGKFMKFSEQLSRKTREWRRLQLVVTRKYFDQTIFFKKYLIRFFSFMF